VQEVASHIAHY